MTSSQTVISPNRSIAFASPHCLLDFTSGAANATAEALRFLARLGFRCHAFCGGHCDADKEVSLEELVGRGQRPFEVESTVIGGRPASIIKTVLGEGVDGGSGPVAGLAAEKAAGEPCPQVPLTLFRTQSSRGLWKRKGVRTVFRPNRTRVMRINRSDPFSPRSRKPRRLLEK